MLYFAFFFWRKPVIESNTTTFSYYKNNAYFAIFIGLILLLIVESIVAHFFLAKFDTTLAWVASLASIYTILWLWGDFQAIRLNPIAINDQELKLNAGLRWQISVPREMIKEVIDISKAGKLTERKDYLSMTIAGEPELVIALNQSLKAKGLFSITKECKYIGIFVDDLPAFKQTLMA
ncbi:MAG: hypothetical protein J0M03_23315 [Acidobacteria bacterium]|nr:hypothetical protein [Acidobacteriota bacterium]